MTTTSPTNPRGFLVANEDKTGKDTPLKAIRSLSMFLFSLSALYIQREVEKFNPSITFYRKKNSF